MSKTISKFLLVMTMLLMLSGCEDKELIKDTVIDCRYNESYTETVTDYTYKYNLHEGKYELVPDIHTDYHPESYELYHEYTYSDGSTRRVWAYCTKGEYLATSKELYGTDY